ncbi:DUF2493 domain-containing protein [Lutibacter sp. A64]|uniref:DUF2493 domain-containing protein n=1 Tax=Lutibacter sp. A64 TaxID=2918526 RepID=UPI001F058FF1|nr:DUF2493 domain-containing protein [Lutibacter sp. A64]UMB55348.1 DUF2493 domain-containing protein [Lutibacter sp. A64]
MSKNEQTTMKLIIAGSRTFSDYKKLKEVCDQFLQDQNNIEIVSGAYYRGADKLGEQYATEKGFPIKQFPADWKKFRRAAGPKRNQQMAKYADALIAFWDGKSKGTKNMIDLAKKENLKVKRIHFET